MAVKRLVFLALALLFCESRAKDFPRILSKEDIGDSQAEAAQLEEYLQKQIGEFYKQLSADAPAGTSGSGIWCPVSLPSKTDKTCQEKREKELEERRKFYRFSDPRKTNQVYPFINVTATDIIKATMSDPELARWIHLNNILLANTNKLLGRWKQEGRSKEIERFDQFLEIFKFFIQNGPPGQEFRYPWVGDANFISISKDENWRHDRYFTDQRFAGVNPLNIHKVTISGRRGIKLSELEKKLNPDFDWSKAVRAVAGISLQKAARRGFLYALRYPLLDNAITMPDIVNKDPRRHMMNTSSPIAIFVLSRHGQAKDAKESGCEQGAEERDRKQYELYPVAIQMDHTQDSAVFTPDSGDEWMLAKATVQLSDGLDSVLFQHVTKVHIVMETICLSVYRQFSENHPLFQLLKQHCGPVLTLNTLSIRRIAAHGGIVHVTTPIGPEGAADIMNKGYNSISWKELGYLADLKKRGVLDSSRLHYYPYRDDGRLIYMTIKYFAWNYVKLYYSTNKEVSKDSELQAFLNEVSANGQGPEGEKGQLKDFPSHISSVRNLINLLAQIIWLSSGRHAAVNYPTSLYFSLTPNLPTKMYTDVRTPDDKFSPFRLPQENVVLAQMSLGVNVGTLRYDSLFDYGSQLEDGVASWLVNACKKYLDVYPTHLIMQRNLRRFKQCHLSYPFLLPSLITNSVAS